MSMIKEGSKENQQNHPIRQFYKTFNTESFDLEDALNKLTDKKFDPKNFDEEKMYYKIYEAVDKKIVDNGTPSQKEFWIKNEDEIYAKCAQTAEEIIKGLEDDKIEDEEE